MIKVSTFFTVILLVAINISLTGQNSLNDLNIIFKHDFNSNTLGKYLQEEYKKDWLYPEWNSRQSTTEIVQDSKNTTNPSKALKLNFPANSISSSEGGAYWPTALQPKYSELYVSYDVMFMPGFQYQKGGKLPSVQGGYIAANTKPTGYDGFTGGLMFKEDGRIVFYIYYADSPREGGISIFWGSKGYNETTFAPSKVNVNYASGDISYANPGTWHNITYRIVLNTVKSGGGGNYDGIMEAYFDGKLVTQVSQILFRHTKDLGIDVMRLYSFFGGNTDDWRNPIAEWLEVDNFLLYTYKDGIDVPRGNTLSPTNRTINYWREFASTVVNPPVEIVNNVPVINAQQFTVQESNFSNNFIGSIIATDKDPGQHLSYSIVSGNTTGLFSLNSQTGDLKTSSNNIFGAGTISHELVVKVTDNAPEPKSATAKIAINLVGESTIVYLNPDNGNDLSENGSIDHPFNSWQDITWKEGFTYLQKRGTETQVEKILITANNVSLGAYGEGDLPVITSETTTYLISGFEKQNIKINSLRLEAKNAVSCVYFLGSSCDSITIDHCVLTGLDNAVKMTGGKMLLSKYNIITSEHEGINSSSSMNEIYYNIFKNCKTGVNVMSNQSKANIYNNVFFDNALSLSVTYAELTLYNNIFYMTSPDQKALMQGSGKISSDHNIFYPEQDGFIEIANTNFNKLQQLQQDFKIDMNSFNSDPQFIDMYSSNFAVEESSPAINAGKNLNLPKDFKGINVPVAGISDIGIYESVNALFTSTETSVMTLYPNPSAGQVNILAEIKQEQSVDDLTFNWSELKVVDISGKTILSKLVEKTGSIIQENIDLSGISNGLYFIVLQMADKVIKEKLIIYK